MAVKEPLKTMTCLELAARLIEVAKAKGDMPVVANIGPRRGLAFVGLEVNYVKIEEEADAFEMRTEIFLKHA